MIDFEKAHDYATSMSNPEPELLATLSQYTQENVRGAHMISGHLQGLFLSMISKMIKPKYIIELGTYTGYSTLCLADGLQQDGAIHTIDTDASIDHIRQNYWSQSEKKNQIIQHIGKGIEVLENLDISFDLAFVDADKGNYINYIELLLKKMPKGSFILADNTLFHGDVLLEEKGKTGTIIHEFNEYVQRHPNLSKVMIPLRDGITLIEIT